MSRIDRYVVSETVGPVFLGFVVSTFILLIRAFFDLAEAIIHRGLPTLTVLKLLALNLPHIVVITLPMALLFGILVAVGRLAADSELTALRASGVSLSYLYRGLLSVSLVLAALNTVLMLYLLPWGNRTYQSMLIEQLSAGATAEIEPRVFNEILDDRTLYVFESAPGGKEWEGVFISDSLPVGQTRFTVADSGSVRIEDQGRRVVVELRSAVEQQLDLGAPTQARISSNQVLTLADQDPARGDIHRSRSSQVRELGWSDLKEWSRDPSRPMTTRALARVEMHKKFSIPAACLVFGLVALPLGFGQRASGRSSAFAQSIAVIAVYYVVQNLGEEGAANGKLEPWVAMWLPNALLFAGGLALLVRRNSDRRGVLATIGAWLFHPLDQLRRARARGRAERALRRAGAVTEGAAAANGRSQARFLLRLPHTQILFPDRIDRYVLRRFTSVGLIVLGAAVTLYLIVDLTELTRYVLENEIPAELVVEHYQYYSLQIVYTIAPIVVLLTTLITFGLLSRSSEITAMKALGVSLYRLAVPVVVAGVVVGAAAAFLDFTILPVTNARTAELRRLIKGHEEPAGLRRATRQWFYSQAEDGGGFIYNYLHFNPQRRLLQRFQAFRFDPGHRLTGHLYASELRLVGSAWVLLDGWSRALDGPRVVRYRELPGPIRLDLRLGPEFFSTEVKSSQEMNYRELREYVTRITASGQWVPDLQTQLHNKVAAPVVCLVMVLVALPFAFRFGRQGALYGVGIAILLGIVLQVVIAFFTTLGEAAVLPPWIAAWGPNLLFSLLSLYLFLGVRT
ncbi:MAG TPA: LptF/LptG family permease [Thermoanaerobaculia bacterium]|nr:LptF/LptG family permease [Thermoanaerobaculia bacterium]